jgi:ankyrin repeat protein
MPDYGYNDLHNASEDGDVETVQTLLESTGRSLLDQATGGGRTSLQLAVRENHVPVVEKLLHAGADVNFRSSSDGRYALHIAAGKGNNTIVNLLLKAGADKDARRNLPPTWGEGGNSKTPLVEAIENGHFSVVETLLSKGADVEGSVYYCASDCVSMHAIDFAALQGDNDIMVALLNKIEGGQRKTDSMDIALILACRKGHLAVVKTMLENGGQVKIRQHDFDQPLICAAEQGYDAIVTLLLENGADPNDIRIDGETPLDMAAFYGHVRTVKTLMNAGAKSERALGSAFEGEHIPVIKAILDSGAETDREKLGDLFSRLTYSGSTSEYVYEATLVLLQHGAPVNIDLGGGQTPLHEQVRESNCLQAVVDLLLRWGADETMLNEDGQTSADVLANNSELAPAVAERVRQLLDNAPKDRAWRRRGWLVMLRARTLKAGKAVVIPEPKQSRGGGGSEGQEARLVDLIIRLEEEGVFRQVMAFL